MSDAKEINTGGGGGGGGGGGEEHNFLSEIWVQQGLSQLSVMRIAGR